jgi:hypothetical protein
MHALLPVLDEAFEDDLFHFFRSKLDVPLDDESLRDRIHTDLVAARRFGVGGRSSLTRFVGLSLLGGSYRFYEDPKAAEALSRPQVDRTLAQLLQHVIMITRKDGRNA